ncbi:MAG TPA: hypothetical protein VFR15_10745 [Chloroflexia bacterium]|nr:hypothetical protein [Chloroflexia bacterium]
MTSTFTRVAGLAGLVGSIVLAALMVAPALIPDNDFLQAPFYGGGAVLLAVFAAGLYRAGTERLGIMGKVGLGAALAAFLSLATIAAFDVFTRLGWGNYEWLWPVLVTSAGVMFAGLAIYSAGATAAGAIPAWAGIPLAIGGAAFVALLIAAVVVGDRAVDAASEVFSTAAIASMVLVAAAVAALGLMLALGRIPGTSESPRTLPSPSM